MSEAEWNNRAVGFVSYGSVGDAHTLLDELIAWSTALAPLRRTAAAA